MDKVSYREIERVARIYNQNKDASAALDISLRLHRVTDIARGAVRHDHDFGESGGKFGWDARERFTKYVVFVAIT